MNLIEMDGFLRGKCLPGDMKVNETNAEYLVRKFASLEQQLAESQREFRSADATIENLQMQVEKLAAENACLKQGIEEVAEAFETGTDRVLATAVDEASNLLTPATDAVLKRIQAQGVEMFASTIKISCTLENSENFVASLKKSIKNEGEYFAAQLRQGGAA